MPTEAFNNTASLLEDISEAVASNSLKDGDGYDLIHKAAALGLTDIVGAILAKDPAMINSTDEEEGYTPLMCAVAGEQEEAVDFLLAHGAADTLNYRDSSATSLRAIDVAYQKCNPVILQKLIDAGAVPALSVKTIDPDKFEQTKSAEMDKILEIALDEYEKALVERIGKMELPAPAPA